jgi:hypothetical protein
LIDRAKGVETSESLRRSIAELSIARMLFVVSDASHVAIGVPSALYLLIEKRAPALIHSKLWKSSSGHAWVRVVLATSSSKPI